MGVQQCPDEGRRWVEGCIPNKPRTLRTTGYVFRTVQQSSDIPDHDGWHLRWLDNGGSCGGVPGWHPDIHGNSWGALEGHSESYGVAPEKQSSSVTAWLPWENDATDRTVFKEELRGANLKACDIAAFFWRSASRFGWHGRIFLEGGAYRLSLFFWWDQTVLIDIYPKWLFWDFTYFFGPRQHFGLFFLTNLCFWEIGSNQSKDLIFRWFSDF